MSGASPVATDATVNPMVKMNLVTVDTPRTLYTKARAQISPEEGTIVVLSQRGKVLDEFTVTDLAQTNGVWVGQTVEGPVIVTKAKGCACGGTKMTTKPGVT